MSDNIHDLASHPRFQGVRRHQPRPVGALIGTPDTGVRAAQILERARRLRKGLLTEADRAVLAINLGELLARFRPGAPGARGVLSALLRDARLAKKEDSTKRAGRYVIWPADSGAPPEELCARFGPYQRLAETAAPRCGLTVDQAVVALARGSSLDPWHGVPDADQATLAALDDLHRLLAHAAGLASRQAGLDEALRSVERWRLNSDDQGLTFYASDHPAAAAPEDAEFWEERLDLLPKVPLVFVPGVDARAEVPATLTDGRAITLAVSLDHAVCLTPGIRTSEGECAPHLVEAYSLRFEHEDFHGHKLTACPFALGEAGIDLWSGEPVTLRRRDNGLARQKVVLSESWLPIDGGHSGVPAGPRVERLSLSSVYRFLFLPLRALAKEDVLGDLRNAALTMNFQGATAAPMGTLASYIERDLREGQASGIRRALLDETARFADDVRLCATEIETYLAGNRDAVLGEGRQD